MDTARFDTLVRALTTDRSRRGLLGGLALGGTLSLLRGQAEAEAKKKCKKKKNGKKKCRIKDVFQPPEPTCSDRVKNGSETDVDCGGGTCPRCAAGQICASRDDCATGLCTGGACKTCALAEECGLDADGVTDCACRDTPSGQRICTKVNCREFFDTGTCAERCLANEQCAAVVGGGIECCLPCGAP